jgi:hypothetical protein
MSYQTKHLFNFKDFWVKIEILGGGGVRAFERTEVTFEQRWTTFDRKD